MESISRRRWLTAAGAVTSLGVLAARWQNLWGAAGGPLGQRFRSEPARRYVQQRFLPNVPVITQDGEPARFYQDLVKNKKVVLTFIDTQVNPYSAKVSDNLATLQKFFGSRIGHEIHLYSITENPEHDTPGVLKAWARRYGAGPGWQFLTGQRSDIEKLRTSLGFAPVYPEDMGDPRYSIGRLMVGDEPRMSWAFCQSQAHARVIAHTMLLDFGPNPAVTHPPPVWDCHRLLKELPA